MIFEHLINNTQKVFEVFHPLYSNYLFLIIQNSFSSKGVDSFDDLIRIDIHPFIHLEYSDYLNGNTFLQKTSL